MSGTLKTKIYDIPASMIKTVIDRWTAKTPKTAKIVQYSLIGAGIVSSVVPLFNVPAWATTVSYIVVAVGTQFLKE